MQDQTPRTHAAYKRSRESVIRIDPRESDGTFSGRSVHRGSLGDFEILHGEHFA